jgi:hypothetical protein
MEPMYKLVLDVLAGAGIVYASAEAFYICYIFHNGTNFMFGEIARKDFMEKMNNVPRIPVSKYFARKLRDAASTSSTMNKVL